MLCRHRKNKSFSINYFCLKRLKMPKISIKLRKTPTISTGPKDQHQNIGKICAFFRLWLSVKFVRQSCLEQFIISNPTQWNRILEQDHPFTHSSRHIFANDVFIGDVRFRLLAEIAREGEWAQCFNFIFNKLLAEIAREKRNERNALTDRQSSRGKIRVAVSAVS